MKIRTKLLLLCGVASGLVLVNAGMVDRFVGTLSHQALEEIVQTKQKDVEARIALSSRGALEQAAVFAQHPAVVKALRTAAQGNLTDEADPAGQAAREMLRAELGPVLDGFEKVQGRRLNLHVHAPGVRSLARLWRERQAKRNGKWVDISDDLSSFRETVREVQETGKSVLGIELGRGGFTVRGLAPVRQGGKVIGSVEVLESFTPVLAMGADEENQLMLFMNEDKLDITTKLRDPEQYPRIEGFVQVVGPAEGPVSLETRGLLAAGKNGLSMKVVDDRLHASFPIEDYQGRQIGVLALERDVSALTAPTRASMQALWIATVVVGLLLSGLGFWMLQRSVVAPADGMSRALLRIAEGDDLGERLDDRRDDELGACAKGFNLVVEHVEALAESSKRLADHLLSLPFPVVELDANQNIAFANEAASKLSKQSAGALEGRPWAEVFRARLNKRAGVVGRAVSTQTSVTDEGYIRAGDSEIRAQLTAMPVRATGGYLVSWMDLEAVYGVVGDVRTNAGQIGDASNQLRTTSEWIAETAGVLQNQAQGVSGATSELTQHLAEASASVGEMSEQANAVAAAMRELDASLADVARNTAETAQVARNVDERSQGASRSMTALEESLASIGSVVEVIEDVADRVGLLALNAKIEASAAGDAGKGFGVVADEVKELARQTSGATEKIRARIQEIRARSTDAVAQTEGIREASDELRRLSESVAAAVEQQSATLSDVSSSVRAAADAAQSMTSRVHSASAAAEELSTSARVVDESARNSADRAGQTQMDAASLAAMADELQLAVERFHLQ